MKKLVILGLIVALSVATATGVALADHSNGKSDGPPKDFVTGAGHHSLPDTQFTISAHSGPLCEDPKGSFSFKTEGPAAHSG